MHHVASRHAVLTKQARMALSISAALCVWCSEASASGPLPGGGKFVAGTGSIAIGANQVNITQSSARGIIDWNSFSIGQGNTVNVDNGSGATLSRVTGSGKSMIDGSLKSTGSFYLVNPQGVVIGKNGVVTTGGRFVASALDTGNDAFMAGGDLSFSGTGTGTVVNLGKISSTGGDVFLISRTLVENDGSIGAPKGSAELAAGDTVLIHDSSAAPQTYVQAASHGDAVNKGSIAAAQIALQAADGNVFALAGHDNALRATGTATRDGHVWLVAPKGTAHVHTSVFAKNADGSGGTVDTAGSALHLDDADIHAAQWNLSAPLFNIGPSTAATLLKQLNQGTSIALDATLGDIVLEQTMRWSGDASLSANAYLSVTVGPMATLGNAGTGNLTLRADASGVDNGGSVTNRGTIDWSKSTGAVAALYDMTGKWTPGTIRSNAAWSAAPFSGLKTQVTAYRLVNSFDNLSKVQNDMGGNYALGRDIDGTDLGVVSDVLGQSSRTAFTGQFDGQGHTITCLLLGDGSGDDAYVGMFWTIGASGVVRNLNLTNTVAMSYNSYVGSVAGINDGLISNVHNTGNVWSYVNYMGGGGIAGINNGTIQRASDSGSIGGIGGIAGSNTGTIVQSWFSGDASGGSHAHPGGIAGTNSGLIKQSYATGSAGATFGSGGLANDNSGTIEESFSTVSVSTDSRRVPPGRLRRTTRAPSITMSSGTCRPAVTRVSDPARRCRMRKD
ncbi:two-partner secretion domain-containing protein [Candidatus Burkholderia verschuerenii]|uniref:two-partner secretion domain-containing protein n=1 Tax=Candidatus Burkholderia verschuerenii TaxID=242163 RepID=UPI00067E17BF|nr:filamentous hemagglutinin N-terminal domain-containing protein [Candidatus Burkholderia verschuerenii]